MKIKNLTEHKNKLLKLKLLNTKIYKKNYALKNLKIEDIEHRLKKGLQIIYKYHVHNKRIVFISNSPTVKLTNLLKNTKHLFMPEYYWINRKASKTFLFMSKKPLQWKNNLIVILDKSVNSNIIKKNYKLKIPIIFLGNDLNALCKQSSYKIPGNFLFYKKKIRENLFLILLKTILKKNHPTKNFKNIKKI